MSLADLHARRPWLLPAVLGASFLLFMAAMWFGSGAPRQGYGTSPRSTGATGFGAWAAWTERGGNPVLLDAGGVLERADRDRTYVWTSAGALDEGTRPELRSDHTVWVVSKYDVLDSDPETGRPTRIELGSLADEAVMLRDLDVEVELSRSAAGVRSIELDDGTSLAVELEDVQTVEGDTLTPVVTCEAGVLVAHVPVGLAGVEGDAFGPTPRGRLWIVAEPDLLNNAGLWRAQHVRVARELLDRTTEPGDPLIFDLTAHGEYRERSFWRELREFPLALLSVHVLVTLGLMAWLGAVRFGAPLPTSRRLGAGRRTLIDNTATLLVSCGYAGRSLRRHLDVALREVAQRHRVQPDADAVADVEAARGRVPQARILEREVRELASGERLRRGDADRIVRLADRIHHWREELLDGAQTGR